MIASCPNCKNQLNINGTSGSFRVIGFAFILIISVHIVSHSVKVEIHIAF